MTQHDPTVSIGQMVDFGAKALEIRGNRSRAELELDELRMLALARTLEVMGEAARRLGPEFHANHPEIPWAGIIGLRNVLSHAYDRISSDLFWQILSKDLPATLLKLQKILRSLQSPKK